MTFEEFENTLQDWLDEGRLEEAHTLIPMVCEADRAECEELLFTYQALFAGLAASSSFDAATPAQDPSVDLPQSGSRWQDVSLPSLALAMALCLTLVALVPGLFPAGDSGTVTPSPALTDAGQPMETPPAAPGVIASTPQIASNAQPQDFTRFATSSFEPLARSMASRTDFAIKSFNQVTTDLNPIDEHLAAYREAAPLINTLTRGFLPGTHSLSNAFSALHESTVEPVAPTQDAEAETLPPSPESGSVVS